LAFVYSTLSWGKGKISYAWYYVSHKSLKRMVKKLITPLQKVLLQRRLCPACTRSLDKAQLQESRANGTNIVVCECSRVFVYDKDLDTFRRAVQQEL